VIEEMRIGLITAALIASAAVELASGQLATAPVETHVPFAPIPVAGTDGLTHLAYELYVTNFYRSTGPLRIERLDIFGDVAAAPLLSYSGDEVERWIVNRSAATANPASDRSIDGGRQALIYVWLPIKPGNSVPASLRHHIVFRTEKGSEEILDGAIVDVRKREPAVLGPPFRGGMWLAHEGPGNSRSHHWGSQLALNGRVTVPQRFALDLIGLNDNGNAVRGDFQKSTKEDWVGFGLEVLAVADGVVRSMQDGIVDNQPLAPLDPPAAFTAQALYGNYVVLDIGSHTFVHYAHLQRNSVAVKPGQRVRRGQVLGRVGTSGNANGPHLHLHVSDAPTFENSEGLPFVFESFEVLGETSAARAIGAERSVEPFRFTPARRRRELPLHGVVIRFP
jgi:hypothetical protein